MQMQGEVASRRAESEKDVRMEKLAENEHIRLSS